MAHKVALINMKGGVGKSTLAVNIAWEMATRPWNKSVLVIDLDPQFNCSQYLVGASRMDRIISDEKPTVWDILEQNTSVPGRKNASFSVSDAIVKVKTDYRSNTGSIDLIPSRLELSHTLRNPSGKDQLLWQAVNELDELYDVIIIDCAPTESVLTTAAYRITDHILIPVRPEFLSSIGLPLLEQSLGNFELQYRGESPSVLGIVFNAISNYSPEEVKSQIEVRDVASKNGWPVFDAEVVYSKSFPKSAREGRPIFNTSYVRYKTTRSFHEFATEFAERVGI